MNFSEKIETLISH